MESGTEDYLSPSRVPIGSQGPNGEVWKPFIHLDIKPANGV